MCDPISIVKTIADVGAAVGSIVAPIAGIKKIEASERGERRQKELLEAQQATERKEIEKQKQKEIEERKEYVDKKRRQLYGSGEGAGYSIGRTGTTGITPLAQPLLTGAVLG